MREGRKGIFEEERRAGRKEIRKRWREEEGRGEERDGAREMAGGNFQL